MFSVVILTFNEEANIEECLASLSGIEDVVVLDSFSTDNTVHLARKYGARVEFRKFDNYAAQRNYALNHIAFDHQWLLMVDADEMVTPELLREILDCLEEVPDDVTLFRMRRKDFFLGRWLRRSSGYPTWFGRLIRLGAVRVEREINEEYVTQGKVRSLDEHLNHFPFRKGIAEWVAKHNRYSSMEAELLVSSPPSARKSVSLWSSDPTARRKSLKEVAFRLPCRPLFMFIGLYFLRGGIWDGRPGLYFTILRSFYEFLIDLKVVELGGRAGCPPDEGQWTDQR